MRTVAIEAIAIKILMSSAALASDVRHRESPESVGEVTDGLGSLQGCGQGRDYAVGKGLCEFSRKLHCRLGQ